jgi:hypothetical protein
MRKLLEQADHLLQNLKLKVPPKRLTTNFGSSATFEWSISDVLTYGNPKIRNGPA